MNFRLLTSVLSNLHEGFSVSILIKFYVALQTFIYNNDKVELETGDKCTFFKKKKANWFDSQYSSRTTKCVSKNEGDTNTDVSVHAPLKRLATRT